mgnify:CR=1
MLRNGEGNVSTSGREVEDTLGAMFGYGSDQLPAPPDISASAEEAVSQIVPSGDAGEHRVYGGGIGHGGKH